MSSTKVASIPSRILVIGCPGAGKSILSRKLAKLLDIPLIHLDALYHQDVWPDGEDEKRVAWRACVQTLVERDRWIIDGNYKNTFDIRMPASDTIIFLDYPRWLTVMRVFLRRVQYHGKVRGDMPSNWKEKTSMVFLKFVSSYRARERAQVLALLEQYRADRRIFIIANPSEAKRLLGKTVWLASG